MPAPSRRTFNNFLILGVLVFIALINLPAYLRTYLSELDEKKSPIVSDVISLFPKETKVDRFILNHLVLKEGTPWQTNQALSVSASELAARWLHLSGSQVDDTMYKKLEAQLPEASIVEVHFKDKAEALRLVYYQFPSFWLIQNQNKQWLAVSVEAEYLFPFQEKD